MNMFQDLVAWIKFYAVVLSDSHVEVCWPEIYLICEKNKIMLSYFESI